MNSGYQSYRRCKTTYLAQVHFPFLFLELLASWVRQVPRLICAKEILPVVAVVAHLFISSIRPMIFSLILRYLFNHISVFVAVMVNLPPNVSNSSCGPNMSLYYQSQHSLDLFHRVFTFRELVVIYSRDWYKVMCSTTDTVKTILDETRNKIGTIGLTS